MARNGVSFKVWLGRIIRFGLADKIDDYRFFGVPFTRGRVLVIVAWRRNYGAPDKSMPSTTEAKP